MMSYEAKKKQQPLSELFIRKTIEKFASQASMIASDYTVGISKLFSLTEIDWLEDWLM